VNRRAVIEHAVGEDRAAIYQGRRLVELHVDRPWQKAPRTGDQFIGRVTNIDPSVAGAWVDIGSDAAPALLPFAAQKNLPKLIEGQSVEVTVLRSQIGAKGATLRYLAESPGAPRCVNKLDLKDRLLQRYPDLTFDEASVNAIDAACETILALPGGGSITLEQTQALLAVDVDKGSAVSAAAAANEAAKLIASQLRLRGLGGLVVVDFPNLRQPKQRKTLERTFESAFEADPNITKFNSLSRFGVIEMTRAKPDLSLDDVLNTKYATPSIETQSLRALRRLTREAAISPGAQLELIVTPEINDWLASAPFDWRTDVTDRIGARFKIVMGASVDVKADR
jgi:Ribonuclease G/E